MGGAARTTANFFNQAREGSNAGSSLGGMSGNLNGPSQNSLFGGDSTSQPMGGKQGGIKSGNFTNVVADDADDDWDEEPSTQPSDKVN